MTPPIIEKRQDGYHLIFDAGEEVGPFQDEAQAREFVDYVKRIQRLAGCEA